MTFAAVSNNSLKTNIISSSVVQTWEKNAGIRFVASGIIGNAIFFSLDKLLLPIVLQLSDGNLRQREFADVYKWIRRNAESVSFFIAYLLDIFFQHLFNALLVFGLETIKTRELYLSSLATSYTAYFSTLCGSTILQAYLLKHGVAKNLAFWGTIAIGSLVNFLVLTTLNTKSTSPHTDTVHISS